MKLLVENSAFQFVSFGSQELTPLFTLKRIICQYYLFDTLLECMLAVESGKDFLTLLMSEMKAQKFQKENFFTILQRNKEKHTTVSVWTCCNILGPSVGLGQRYREGLKVVSASRLSEGDLSF